MYTHTLSHTPLHMCVFVCYGKPNGRYYDAVN